jgi:hypothetical protein
MEFGYSENVERKCIPLSSKSEVDRVHSSIITCSALALFYASIRKESFELESMELSDAHYRKKAKMEKEPQANEMKSTEDMSASHQERPYVTNRDESVSGSPGRTISIFHPLPTSSHGPRQIMSRLKQVWGLEEDVVASL